MKMDVVYAGSNINVKVINIGRLSIGKPARTRLRSAPDATVHKWLEYSH